MPYEWINSDSPSGAPARKLHLWPHQSLPPRGYARFIGITALMISLPLLPLL